MTGVEAKAGERGFALLIVFLMAAAIALMLYQQMPRVAFESERDKEELLIDRGEQYQRAIQLYMVVNKRYPAKIEDLENTNDKRFLRRRYIDPFTGKSEWRLVHTNGMFLTDSLVQKPPTADGKNPDGTDKKNTTASSTTGTTATNPDGTTPAPDVNATVLQRPSDRTLPTGIPGQPAGIPGQPGFPPITTTNDPSQVGIGPGGAAFPPITLAQIQGTAQTGTVNGQQVVLSGNGQNNVPGTVQPGLPGGPPTQLPVPVNGQLPGQGQPGQGQPGLPFGQGAAGADGGQGLANAGNQPNGGALGMIRTLLTTPQTPPAGIVAPTANNNTVGGGIAGVASTYTGPSIKSYNTRTKFNEWEFVFQPQQQGVPAPPPNTGPNGNAGGGTVPPTGPGTGTTQ